MEIECPHIPRVFFRRSRLDDISEQRTRSRCTTPPHNISFRSGIDLASRSLIPRFETGVPITICGNSQRFQIPPIFSVMLFGKGRPNSRHILRSVVTDSNCTFTTDLGGGVPHQLLHYFDFVDIISLLKSRPTMRMSELESVHARQLLRQRGVYEAPKRTGTMARIALSRHRKKRTNRFLIKFHQGLPCLETRRLLGLLGPLRLRPPCDNHSWEAHKNALVAPP